MVKKYIYGKPFQTEAVVALPSDCEVFQDSADFPDGSVAMSDGFSYTYNMQPTTVLYGLGQQMGGINKRGKVYKIWCSDDPVHTEEKTSLYGAHNFVLVFNPGGKSFGLFFDYPGELTVDAGWTTFSQLSIKCEVPALAVYHITGDSLSSIVKQFRDIIGPSYEEPFWSFGFMQSRWGYGSAKDICDVYDEYKKCNIGIDAIFLDIDYMEGFRDFTYSKVGFPEGLKPALNNLLQKGIHVVPIIDAGIKSEKAFFVDREGIKQNFYCKKSDGTVFSAAVWPGFAHFPDFLSPEAREWFGGHLQELLDDKVGGFWFDMNEPALFYSSDGIAAFGKRLAEYSKEIADCENSEGNKVLSWPIKDDVLSLANNIGDYQSFYHNVARDTAGSLCDDKSSVPDNSNSNKVYVRHDKIHNLYGYNFSRSGSEFMQKYCKQKGIKENKFLLSRASYIGSHRYTGIWMGDNQSWWAHILLCLHMLPNLNMVGFLYTGCDLGGFGSNTDRALLLRFLALGVFTPLMRNHSALGTRQQECYRFEDTDDFRAIISLRYRLVPFIYNECIKASRGGSMMFRPLGFDYPDDPISISTEDELMLGDGVLIAPVYTPNATGRMVYLPEDMTEVRCSFEHGCVSGEPIFSSKTKGTYFVECALNEVVFFLKKGYSIPVAPACQNTRDIDYDSLTYWGESAFKYELLHKGK